MTRKTISIIGSCACRDFFEFNKNDFEIMTDVRFSSPISIVSNPLSNICISMTDFTKDIKSISGNWYKKTVINDFNKTIFSALRSRHGEYLVLDLAESRIPLAKITDKVSSENTIITFSTAFRKHYYASLKRKPLNSISIESISPLSIRREEWLFALKKFVDQILKIFDPSKIIIIENMPATEYIDSNLCVTPYATEFHLAEIKLCSVILPFLYRELEILLPKSFVIKIPNKFLGDCNHKWGTHPFHFQESYYRYLFECAENVVLKKGNELNLIYSRYEKMFLNEYEKASLNRINLFYNRIPNKTCYANIIASSEELFQIGKRRTFKLLWVLSKKEAIKYLKQNLKREN